MSISLIHQDLAWLITDLARLAKLLRQNPVTCPASHALYAIKTSDLCSENANYSNGLVFEVDTVLLIHI